MPDPAVRPTPDEEWEALLRQRPPARPRPFFYPRLAARLAAGPAAARPALPGWLRRPAYAVLCGAVLLALSGDGSALRPMQKVAPCQACPGGRLLREPKR